MEMVVPRYLHCSTIGIFDLPWKIDGELTFYSFLLKHKENGLDQLITVDVPRHTYCKHLVYPFIMPTLM